MAKANIQSAFRLLPIHPKDFCPKDFFVKNLFGRFFQFEGSYYADKRMSTGLSVSCAEF